MDVVDDTDRNKSAGASDISPKTKDIVPIEPQPSEEMEKVITSKISVVQEDLQDQQEEEKANEMDRTKPKDQQNDEKQLEVMKQPEEPETEQQEQEGMKEDEQEREEAGSNNNDKMCVVEEKQEMGIVENKDGNDVDEDEDQAMATVQGSKEQEREMAVTEYADKKNDDDADKDDMAIEVKEDEEKRNEDDNKEQTADENGREVKDDEEHVSEEKEKEDDEEHASEAKEKGDDDERVSVEKEKEDDDERVSEAKEKEDEEEAKEKEEQLEDDEERVPEVKQNAKEEQKALSSIYSAGRRRRNQNMRKINRGMELITVEQRVASLFMQDVEKWQSKKGDMLVNFYFTRPGVEMVRKRPKGEMFVDYITEEKDFARVIEENEDVMERFVQYLKDTGEENVAVEDGKIVEVSDVQVVKIVPGKDKSKLVDDEDDEVEVLENEKPLVVGIRTSESDDEDFVINTVDDDASNDDNSSYESDSVDESDGSDDNDDYIIDEHGNARRKARRGRRAGGQNRRAMTQEEMKRAGVDLDIVRKFKNDPELFRIMKTNPTPSALFQWCNKMRSRMGGGNAHDDVEGESDDDDQVDSDGGPTKASVKNYLTSLLRNRDPEALEQLKASKISGNQRELWIFAARRWKRDKTGKKSKSRGAQDDEDDQEEEEDGALPKPDAATLKKHMAKLFAQHDPIVMDLIGDKVKMNEYVEKKWLESQGYTTTKTALSSSSTFKFSNKKLQVLFNKLVRNKDVALCKLLARKSVPQIAVERYLISYENKQRNHRGGDDADDDDDDEDEQRGDGCDFDPKAMIKHLRAQGDLRLEQLMKEVKRDGSKKGILKSYLRKIHEKMKNNDDDDDNKPKRNRATPKKTTKKRSKGGATNPTAIQAELQANEDPEYMKVLAQAKANNDRALLDNFIAKKVEERRNAAAEDDEEEDEEPVPPKAKRQRKTPPPQKKRNNKNAGLATNPIAIQQELQQKEDPEYMQVLEEAKAKGDRKILDDFLEKLAMERRGTGDVVMPTEEQETEEKPPARKRKADPKQKRITKKTGLATSPIAIQQELQAKEDPEYMQVLEEAKAKGDRKILDDFLAKLAKERREAVANGEDMVMPTEEQEMEEVQPAIKKKGAPKKRAAKRTGLATNPLGIQQELQDKEDPEYIQVLGKAKAKGDRKILDDFLAKIAKERREASENGQDADVVVPNVQDEQDEVEEPPKKKHQKKKLTKASAKKKKGSQLGTSPTAVMQELHEKEDPEYMAILEEARSKNDASILDKYVAAIVEQRRKEAGLDDGSGNAKSSPKTKKNVQVEGEEEDASVKALIESISQQTNDPELQMLLSKIRKIKNPATIKAMLQRFGEQTKSAAPDPPPKKKKKKAEPPSKLKLMKLMKELESSNDPEYIQVLNKAREMNDESILHTYVTRVYEELENGGQAAAKSSEVEGDASHGASLSDITALANELAEGKDPGYMKKVAEAKRLKDKGVITEYLLEVFKNRQAGKKKPSPKSRKLDHDDSEEEEEEEGESEVEKIFAEIPTKRKINRVSASSKSTVTID